MTRLFKTWLPAARRATLILAATATALGGHRAAGQQAAVDLQSAIQTTSLPDGYLTEPPMVNTSVVEAYGPELPHGSPLAADRQPVNWISGPYLKAGAVTALEGGILKSPDAGYTISLGFRTPLSAALDERLFFDLGGSYLSAFGQNTHVTTGQRTTGGVITNIDLNSTLKEVQRGSVHTALGWYWGDPIDARSNDPQLRFATRIGGRLGHVRGQFDETPVLTPPADSIIRSLHSKADTSGGLFVGTEAILLNRDFAGGSVQFTVDGEYANDWIEFGGWGSGSLGSASILLGFMFSR